MRSNAVQKHASNEMRFSIEQTRALAVKIECLVEDLDVILTIMKKERFSQDQIVTIVEAQKVFMEIGWLFYSNSGYIGSKPIAEGRSESPNEKPSPIRFQRANDGQVHAIFQDRFEAKGKTPQQALERLRSALKQEHPESSREYLKPIQVYMDFLLQT